MEHGRPARAKAEHLPLREGRHPEPGFSRVRDPERIPWDSRHPVHLASRKALATAHPLLHNPLTSVTFPVYLRLGGISIPPHPFFECIAYAAAFCVYLALRKRIGDVLSGDMRWWVIAAATVGAAGGSKLLGILESPQAFWHGPSSGKTIVGGLVGGWLAVEWIKRHFSVNVATGDLFAIPLAIGIAIGRAGCFLTGLADQTYGSPTTLPWGVDFGDGVSRHPAQVYEIGFLLGLALLLWRMLRAPHATGDVFKAFMIAYLSWRFVIDFFKEDPTFCKISAIQWTCLVVLLVYRPHLARVTKALLGFPNNEIQDNPAARVAATDL
jgi:phosphatidylglycerol---prolipoprotein diacylglyceryl transferase